MEDDNVCHFTTEPRFALLSWQCSAEQNVPFMLQFKLTAQITLGYIK